MDLSPGTIADGSAPGTVVGTLTLTAAFTGRLERPRYSLPPTEASNALFTLGSDASGDITLLTRFQANGNVVPGYLVSIHVNVGLGDMRYLFEVAVTGVRPIQALSAPPTGQLPSDSFATSISGDGRYTVFTSTAQGLVTGQVNGNTNQNVFLYDRETGTTTLVNHVPGSPVTTGDGGLDKTGSFPADTMPPRAVRPVISADGQYVAFASYDDNLVPGQPAQAGGTPSLSVYRYSVQTGQIVLVNHGSAGGTSLADGSNPVISANGRYVAYAFGSSSANGGIALYDSAQDTTTVIPGSLGGDAGNPSISDDGRFVTYQDGSNVYLFDSSTGTSTLVSHAATSLTSPAGGTASAPVISHDGTTVAFVSTGTDLVAGQSAGGPAGLSNVFLYHNDGTGAVTLVSGAGGSATVTGNGNSDSPALGAGATYVAYRSDATDLVSGQVAGSNVYEFNAQNGTQTLISHQAGVSTAAADGSASDPVMDDDGHLVAYVSTGDDLIPGQGATAGVKNVYLWLRQTGANILASGQDGSQTVPGNADSDFPLLTRDSFPAFSSRATNLLPGVGGSSVVYINRFLTLALSPNTVSDGSAAGSPAGTLSVTNLLPGQFVPAVYQLQPPTSDYVSLYDNPSFALGPNAGGTAPLVTLFPADYLARTGYLIRVFVDAGFGWEYGYLPVYIGPPGATGGNASIPADATDVTALIPVSRSKSRRHGAGLRQTLTLGYRGPDVGSLFVVLTGLPRTVKLLGATGSTYAYSRRGSPFVTVPLAGQTPGKSITLQLRFRSPSRRVMHYGLLVLADVFPAVFLV